MVFRYSLLLIMACSILTMSVGLAAAATSLHPGLELVSVGDSWYASASSRVTQMAFGPDGRLYTTTSNNQLFAYQVDATSGQLTAREQIINSKALGIAFHGNDCYITTGLQNGSGVGKIIRYRGSIVDGLWQPGTGVAIVSNIPIQKTQAHAANQLVVIGDSLFVGIGILTSAAEGTEESCYSGTVAWIEDLTAVPHTGGAANVPGTRDSFLASATSPNKVPLTRAGLANPSQHLVVYATGLRNPYGIGADGSGQLWVSNNFSRENNHAFYFAPDNTGQSNSAGDVLDSDFSNDVHDQFCRVEQFADYQYRLRAWRDLMATESSDFFQVGMRRRSFTFDGSFAYRDHGAFVWNWTQHAEPQWPTSRPAYDSDNPNAGGLPGGLGPHSSSNGFAFATTAVLPSDLQGDCFIARWSGSLTETAGGDEETVTYKDVVSVDMATGAVQRIAKDFRNPIDVVEDPQGRLLIADWGGNIYMLRPSATVNLPPQVVLTAPAADSTLPQDEAVTISAAATDSDGSVSSVQFKAGDTVIATDTTAPFSASWTPTSSGSHVLSAIATDDDGSSASDSITVTVAAPPPVIGECNRLRHGQSNGSSWYTANLLHSYTNPVVVMAPLSYNGGHPTTMRVKNVAATSFQYQMDEYDYLDGGHTTEDMGMIVLEAGVHQLGDLQVVAGHVEQVGTGFTSSSFAATFASTPVVLTQVVSVNEASAVVTRHNAVSPTGFQVKLREEEAANNQHAGERVAYIAIGVGIGSSDGLPVLSGRTGDEVTHQWKTVSYGQSLSDPVIFAAMQANDGNDTATLRLRNRGSTSTQFFVEEEQSKDSEKNHTKETVGWLAFDRPGLIIADPGGVSKVNRMRDALSRVWLQGK